MALQHTTRPITVMAGTVLGIVYDEGVLLMADTLVSFGRFARYKNQTRIRAVGDDAILGATGELVDFQDLMRSVDLDVAEELAAAGEDRTLVHSASERFSWLVRVMAHARSKIDPYYNQFVFAGLTRDKKPYDSIFCLAPYTPMPPHGHVSVGLCQATKLYWLRPRV